MTLKDLTCLICNATLAKYKCPRCREAYCSVNCCKQHKSKGCEPILTIKERLTVEEGLARFRHLTEDTVPLDKLELLKSSKKLKEIISNPHVRQIMESINISSEPTQLIREAMLEPIFVEFADECLRIVQDIHED